MKDKYEEYFICPVCGAKINIINNSSWGYYDEYILVCYCCEGGYFKLKADTEAKLRAKIKKMKIVCKREKIYIPPRYKSVKKIVATLKHIKGGSIIIVDTDMQKITAELKEKVKALGWKDTDMIYSIEDKIFEEEIEE